VSSQTDEHSQAAEHSQTPEHTAGSAPGEEPRSLGAITSDVTTDLSDLVRAEMALAKAEVRQEVRTAGKGGVFLVGATLLALLVLMLLAMSVGFLIANVIGDDLPAFALGFFLAGIVFAIPAGIVGFLARKRLQQVDPVPRKTADSVSADVQAVKERKA
jgi:hypothetical protein